ncbi:hypothetical protein ACFE04_031346 [Oxalis oulophora]
MTKSEFTRKDFGFTSFIGRLLFSSFFIMDALYEYSQFDTDGGPIVQSLLLKNGTHSNFGPFKSPTERFETYKNVAMILIIVEIIGAFLFLVPSSLVGANILLIHQFFASPYIYSHSVAHTGALFFYIELYDRMDMDTTTEKKTRKKKKKSASAQVSDVAAPFAEHHHLFQVIYVVRS